ncbi:MAG: DMT family transporter [Oscillospiraceae bacterium]|nr:DMT family transporter [Oscillospiraceae bacterium]
MKQNNAAVAAVIVGNSIFGFSFLFSKLALELTEPSVLIAVRFTAAFVLMNLIILVGRLLKNRKGQPLLVFSLKGKPKKDILLLAIFQPIVYFIAENYGITYTSSAFSGIIIALIPLAGILFDVLFMGQRAQKVQVICAVISVAGVILTALGAQGMHSSLKGLVFLLIAVAAGALFYVFSSKSAPYYSPLERTYVMFGCGTLVFVLFAFVRCCMAGPAILTGALSAPLFWLAILYLSCISSIVAFLLLNFGSSHVSVSQATLFANITTVLSIFAGVIFLKEAFTWLQALGAIFIISSVYLSQRMTKSRP